MEWWWQGHWKGLSGRCCSRSPHMPQWGWELMSQAAVCLNRHFSGHDALWLSSPQTPQARLLGLLQLLFGVCFCISGERGREDHRFWNKVLVTATSSICDGSFYVSTWLCHDAWISCQTLFWEENREPSNKPMHLWSINVQQRSHEYTTGKGESFQ